jgi:hypothetical protein
MQLIRAALLALALLAPASLAAAQSVWWSQADGIRRFDAATSTVERRDARPRALLVDPDATWHVTDTAIVRTSFDGHEATSALVPAPGVPAHLTGDGGGGAWLAHGGTLVHYDAALKVRATFTLATSVEALATAGPGALWVAAAGAVLRLDAAGRVVERHALAAPNAQVRALQLDAATGELLVDIASEAVVLYAHEKLREARVLHHGAQAAWSLDPTTGDAWRVDARTLAVLDRHGDVIASWDVPRGLIHPPSALAVDVDAARVWISDDEGVVMGMLDTGEWQRMAESAPARLAERATWLVPDIDVVPEADGRHLLVDVAPRCRPVACAASPEYAAHSTPRAWLDDTEVPVQPPHDAAGRWRIALAAASAQVATLRVEVTDAYGNTSPGRRFDIAALRTRAAQKTNQPPAIALTAPANNAVAVAPATFALAASASDADGTIAKVEFYRNGTLLGADATAPYTFAWSNVPAGTYALTAKAYDNGGAVTTSATVNVQVKANVAPTVTLTSPPNNANFVAPATLTLSATATDSDGTVSKVDFLRGGSTLIATVTTSPFTYTWTNVAAGTYSLTAKATDDKGAATTSAAVIAKANNPPSVTLTAPANNSSVVAPANVTLQATASDTDGTIAKVEFFQNGTLLGADTTSPYTFAWTSPAIGNYTLTAKATDNLGATRVSAPVAFSVKANQPPVVTLTSPTTNLQRVAGTALPVTATASDPDGTVTKVEFRLGGVLMSSDTTSPYAGTVTVMQGAFALTATAIDNKGTQTVSAPLTITGVANQPPAVTLDSPVDGQVIAAQSPPDIVLRASAHDPDGTIARVRFMAITHLDDGSQTTPYLIGTATQAPYSTTWPAVPFSVDVRNDGRLGPDQYEVWAEADDDAGATSVSPSAFIRVTNWSPWTARILDTANELAPPATLVVVGSVTRTSGLSGDAVARVDLVADGTVVASLTGPNGAQGEYVFTWPNVPIGTHDITLSVVDAAGFAVSSPDHTLVVRPVSQPPTVRLTAPAHEQQLLPVLPSVALAATATDADGTVAAVDFIADGSVVATTTAPYTATWPSVGVGVHAVSAVARDNRGYIAESPPAIVNVMLSDRPPVVVLTSPAPGTGYRSGTPVTLSADAVAPDGAIARVDFVDDVTAQVLGSATSAPYRYTALLPAGTSRLRAVAVLVNHRTGTSTPVVVTASSNASPSVTLTAPRDGLVSAAGSPITLSATASDPDGTIARVEFLVNGTVAATSVTSPYTASWVPPAAGAYAITARATDNAGASASTSPANVTIVAASAVSISSPAAGSVVIASQPLAIRAAASMSGRSIARIDFLVDGASIGSVPIVPAAASATATFTWAAPSVGSHSVVARAVATDGTTLSSAAVSIQASDFTVGLSEPYAGQAFIAPGEVRITAAPVSTGTIGRVDFIGDGVLVASASAPPYTTVWRNMGVGPHTVSVRAVEASGLSVVATAGIQVIAAPAIALDAGIDGSSLADDAASVTGTVQAPAHASLIINGRAAALDPLGRFFLDNLLLEPGINRIVLSLNTHDAAPVQQTLTLTSTGAAPFAVDLSPHEGFAPLATTLSIRNRTATAYSRVEIDTNDDGTPEQTLAIVAGGELRLAYTFPTPGVYRIRVTVYDAANKVIYQARRQLRVYDRAELAGNVVSVYWTMLDRLGANDPTAALRLFTADAQDRYADVFATLGNSVVSVAPQLRRIVDGVVGDDIAELTHLRDTPNGPALFMIYLVRGRDGLWRIETM